ncbi:4-hydroxythreonine-4-phosphate dehydrogenase PdxA [Hydrogenophaga sp.]|uniref:PdxA family dehydrogenase n=1 Tax=Hydrogenophaga sp. TaxID=1904254 RepID=UPI002CC16681|nr:4-hydroxythreonine-4-phosphate dehydrogenase PdxA [Hydrogenophaga sp.]HMP11936.1 4-hydroxythreonine-4-phosphate dehydrogenase PdxA [Hydrogenophaga sp.]
MKLHRRIALALGDPHGIGPEIALKALAQLPEQERSKITLFGPSMVLEEAAAICGLESLLPELNHRETGTLPGKVQFGTVSPDAGRSAIESATAALNACREGEFDAVLACPHHETAIHQAGIPFSGYPSLVAQVCGVNEQEVFLMLVGGGLKIVHVTLHESVQTALDRLSTGLVSQAVHAGVRCCQTLGIQNPKVALFGINPHASEGTLFGPEDARITVPAASELRQAGLQVDGPMGADVALANRQHDLYVAIFHDQGHIPVKLLAPNAASALSIGADVLLSSVGHGSAMDIAGKGIADPTAVLRTIALLSGSQATQT